MNDIIKYLSTSKYRENKSKAYIDFYCYLCHIIHENHPVLDIICINENMTVCKSEFNEILKPYVNDR